MAGCSARFASIPPTRTRSTRSGIDLNVSRDAGKTFTRLRGTHGDHHGLWIDPAKPATLYSANDGGFYLSDDAGKSWNYARAAGGVQFYNVTLDSSTPAWAYGSIQDDGSRRGRIDLSAGRDRIPAVEFVNAPGGEGSHHAIDPADLNIVFSHGFYGNFTRSNVAPSPAPAGASGGATRDAAARTRRTRRSTHPASRGRRRAAGAVDGADRRVDARAGRDLRRLPVRLSLGKSRRVVGADQFRPDVERPVTHAAARAAARSPSRRSRRWRNRRAGAACSMRGPTTASCT